MRTARQSFSQPRRPSVMLCRKQEAHSIDWKAWQKSNVRDKPQLRLSQKMGGSITQRRGYFSLPSLPSKICTVTISFCLLLQPKHAPRECEHI